MALVREFVHVSKGSNRVHGEVECGYLTFASSGRTYLQLDTLGKVPVRRAEDAGGRRRGRAGR